MTDEITKLDCIIAITSISAFSAFVYFYLDYALALI